MKRYTVTVQLRSVDGAPPTTMQRDWTTAADSADAILLTLTHLSYAEGLRVERVLVTEAAS
jgi:hypothetical protein